jgi:hypothetical protein
VRLIGLEAGAQTEPDAPAEQLASGSGVRCVLVKIHGVGYQQRDWSRLFDGMMEERLARLSPERQAGFTSSSVWWGDYSRRPVPAESTPGDRLASHSELQVAMVRQAYAQHLLDPRGRFTGGSLGAAGLDLGVEVARIDGQTVRTLDLAGDVAAYAVDNRVRARVQHRLARDLLGLQGAFPAARIILASHGQGAMVAYDVLRVIGSGLPSLGTWVTMGSPLAWYLSVLHWGAEPLGLPRTLTWLNLYDREDRVGTRLAGLLTPPLPAVVDIDVDNRGHGLDAHDYWANPGVAERYFRLVERALD